MQKHPDLVAKARSPDDIRRAFWDVRRTAIERDGWFTSGDEYLADRSQSLRDSLSRHLSSRDPAIGRAIAGPQADLVRATAQAQAAEVVKGSVDGAWDSVETYRGQAAAMTMPGMPIMLPDADQQLAEFHQKTAKMLRAMEQLRGPSDTDMTGAGALHLHSHLARLRAAQDSIAHDLESPETITYGMVDQHASQLRAPLKAVHEHMQAVVDGRRETVDAAQQTLNDTRERAEIKSMAGEPGLDSLAQQLDWAAQDPKGFLKADRAREITPDSPRPAPAPSPAPTPGRSWRPW